MITALAIILTMNSLAFALDEVPVVRTIDPELQKQITCLNAEYLLFAPDQQTNEKLPLLIFLHGARGVGNDIQMIKSMPTAIRDGIKRFEKGPCIIVAPQCLKGEKGDKGASLAYVFIS